ncbi:Hypothetical predicted protein, partial [Marmota monax]
MATTSLRFFFFLFSGKVLIQSRETDVSKKEFCKPHILSPSAPWGWKGVLGAPARDPTPSAASAAVGSARFRRTVAQGTTRQPQAAGGGGGGCGGGAQAPRRSCASEEPAGRGAPAGNPGRDGVPRPSKARTPHQCGCG